MKKTNLAGKYALAIFVSTFIGLMSMVGLQAWQLNQSAAQLKEQSRQSFVEETQRLLLQRGSSMADYLSYATVEPYLAFDMLALYDLMVPPKQSAGVTHIYFFNINGQVVHDGTREIQSYGEDVTQRYLGLNPTAGVNQLIRSDTSLAFVRPVKNNQKLLGGVVIEISTDAFSKVVIDMQDQMDAIAHHSMRNNLTGLLFTSAIIITLALFFAIIAGRRLARPISELAKQAERIGSGIYDTSVQIERADEIGDLAQAFDTMRINLRQQTERIEYQAYFDALTGLHNRVSFHNLMSSTFVSSNKTDKHVLLYLDMDGFKRVNDGLGHGAGDRLLKELANRMRAWALQVIETNDVSGGCDLGRWGGDQFAVLLTDVSDITVVESQARDLLIRLSKPCVIAGMEVVLSASIGYAIYPTDAQDSDTLMSSADLAMYRSKRRGKNQVSAYFAHREQISKYSLVMESEIRNALRQQQFELLYYPSIDTTSRAVIGLEVVPRWNHPERGELKPSHFLGAMMTAGLMKEFRTWAINAGLDNLRTWHKMGYSNLQMNFNIANLDFDPGWLGDLVADSLERTEIDSRYVNFELSEASFAIDIVRTSEILQDLKVYGIKVWINDFGIGYSSLDRLRRVQIAGIKLHSSVVQKINTSQDSQQMVSASIAMAHGFGVQAGADGVEDDRQLSFLRHKGCDFVQGMLVSRPLKEQAVEAYLARSYVGTQLKLTS